MKGLYSAREISCYLGCRPQDVTRMMAEDGLPCLTLPGKKRPVSKVALHGLHGWLKARHSGTAFMSVEELALEIEGANEAARPEAEPPGLRALKAAARACLEAVAAEYHKSLEGVKAA